VTQTSQDFYSDSSDEANNYFAGVAANNDTPKDFRPESPDYSFPINKPGDISNYDDVFSPEEKAVREHNLSVIKLEL
jgi:hypothetical protein